MTSDRRAADADDADTDANSTRAQEGDLAPGIVSFMLHRHPGYWDILLETRLSLMSSGNKEFYRHSASVTALAASPDLSRNRCRAAEESDHLDDNRDYLPKSPPPSRAIGSIF